MDDMVKIELINNLGYKWTQYEDIFIKGYFFYNGKYLNDNEIYNFLKDNRYSISSLKNLINNIDGSYSIIINNEENVLIITDLSRSFPIFIIKKEQNLKITDSLTAINISDFDINKESFIEFVSCGYTLGNKTLLKNVYQTKPATITKIDKKAIKIFQEYYWIYRRKPITRSINDLFDCFDKFLKNTSLKLFEISQQYSNNVFVVPLSGGFDSRIILYMLSLNKSLIILSFTYGKKNNYESIISEKIANLINKKWFFLEYSDEEWYQFRIKYMKDFFDFSFNFSSLPHFQDFISVKILKEKFFEKNKSYIFVPGYSGDLFQSSRFLNEMIKGKIYDATYIKEFLYHYHFLLNPDYSLNNKNIILRNFKIKNSYLSNYKTLEFIEGWDLQERQSKFIKNAVRTYEFFNFKWVTPLIEKEYINFFSSLEMKHLNAREFVIKYLKLKGLYLKEDKRIVNIKFNKNNRRLIILIKKFLNYIEISFFRKKFIKSLEKKDIMNYLFFIEKNYISKKKTTHINSYTIDLVRKIYKI